MNHIEKEKLIKADIASIENRVRHAFNQGYDLGYKEGKANCSEIPTGSTTKNDLGVDAISRDEVCRYVAEFVNHEFSTKEEEELIDNIITGIEHLPSVTPIRPKGHWIVQPSNKEQGERDFIWWKCSECGQVIFSETEHDRLEFHAFCGRCGAKMVESQESEET